MSDDDYLYDEAPGLKELLERAEDRTLNHTIEVSLQQVQRKTQVVRRYNEATGECIDQIRNLEKGLHCLKAWERHVVPLLLASSDPPAQQLEADDPLPRIVQNHGPDQDAITRLVNEIHEAQHPFLKRIAS